MAKQKSLFVCLNCQHQLSRWSGRCPHCGEWNTVVEQQADDLQEQINTGPAAELIRLKDLPKQTLPRLTTNSVEFDRVLGSTDPGIVVGSMILLAGNPGVGKSTLLLQIAESVKNAVYFSAEESLEQIRLRSSRLGLTTSSLKISAERRLPNILRAIAEQKPSFVVIDSVQTIFDDTIPGTPGSLVQVRENCWRLQQFAKQAGVAILLVGHVTKEGVIAGPKVLEHLVDVVLYLEGEKQTGLRVLRCDKNRFGATDEVGIWQLSASGFLPVADPGKLFASIITEDIPGRALSVTLEGSRAFLIEIQALVTKTAFGYPKRTVQGLDLGRLNLLIAVLENRLGLPTNQYDIYANIVGGFTVKDTGIDLAVAAAIASGISGRILPKQLVLVGEVGLLGEIRPAVNQTRRTKEVHRLKYQLGQGITTIQELPKTLEAKKSTK